MPLSRRFAALGTLLWRPDLARLYAAGSALLVAFVACYQTLGRLLETHYDLGPSALQHARLAGVPSMLVGPLVLSLCRGHHAAATAATGLRLAAIALIGLASATGRPLWTAILISAIFVLGVAIAVPALIAAVNQRAPDAPRAAASLYSATAFTGASLAPVLATPAIASSALALLLALGLAAASVAASRTRATPNGCAC